MRCQAELTPRCAIRVTTWAVSARVASIAPSVRFPPIDSSADGRTTRALRGRRGRSRTRVGTGSDPVDRRTRTPRDHRAARRRRPASARRPAPRTVRPAGRPSRRTGPSGPSGPSGRAGRRPDEHRPDHGLDDIGGPAAEGAGRRPGRGPPRPGSRRARPAPPARRPNRPAPPPGARGGGGGGGGDPALARGEAGAVSGRGASHGLAPGPGAGGGRGIGTSSGRPGPGRAV